MKTKRDIEKGVSQVKSAMKVRKQTIITEESKRDRTELQQLQRQREGTTTITFKRNNSLVYLQSSLQKEKQLKREDIR